MIDRLVRTFLQVPVLAIMLCVVLGVWGWRSYEQNPKDAIPDIAENQAIVFSEWMGRSPKDVDEQVTYPLTVALQGVAGEFERFGATSGFGWSIVYVVFHDDVEFYWARSRVLERLNVGPGRLARRRPPRDSARTQPRWARYSGTPWRTDGIRRAGRACASMTGA